MILMVKGEKSRCCVCGRFTADNAIYCPEHGKEYPDCRHFMCPPGHPDFNVCEPNIPHSCRRARKEKECPGYEKRPKIHNIIDTKTGEVIASGNTGLELMEAFSKTATYKEIFRSGN